MANQTYPTNLADDKPPVQTLTFVYEGGGLIYFYLYPQPDAKGQLVADVKINYEMPGWPNVIQMETGTLTLIQAGALAYNQAQAEGQAAQKGKFKEVWLGGSEFLTKPDLEDIVGRAFPVVLK